MQARTLSPRSEIPVRSQVDGVALYDSPVYFHTSTFRSRHIELNIQSPSVEQVEDPKFIGQSIPVFSGTDSIGGTVITTIPAVISTEHHLVISIEGALFWTSPQKEGPQSLPLDSSPPQRIKHVFLSSSVAIPLAPSPSPVEYPLKHSVSIRSVFQDGIRNTLFRRTKSRPRRRRGTTPSHAEAPHVPSDPGKTFHNFSFPLPVVQNREIPSTLSVSRLCRGGIRGRWYAEGVQIAYKVTAQVSPVPGGEHDTRSLEERLEAPIFVESIDIAEEDIERSWSRTTLTCPTDLPFLALPHRGSFARNDTIPFYVLFTTSPKSEPLARRIFKESRIRVSLIRQLRLDPGLAFSVPLPRTRHSDKNLRPKRRERSSNPPRRAESRMPKIFTWQRKHNDPVWSSGPSSSTSEVGPRRPVLRDKPLPALPEEASNMYEDVICSVVADGFPKRAAFKEASVSFESNSGPDGVFKGYLRLSNELSNTVDWPGISLSYFVEASVVFEDGVVRARYGVRLAEPYG